MSKGEIIVIAILVTIYLIEVRTWNLNHIEGWISNKPWIAGWVWPLIRLLMILIAVFVLFSQR